MIKKFVIVTFLFTLAACSPAAAPTAEIMPSVTPLPSSTPEPTFTIEPTLTPTPPPTATPTLGVGSTEVSAADGMVQVYVPGGTFQMGSAAANAMPVHEVTLSSFWIDQTEVTVGQYALCVAASACPLPKKTNSNMRKDYYNDPSFVDFPVIQVTWENANTYCRWAGRKLPLEAQWEYAARGDDGREYPWGNASPTCELANISWYNPLITFNASIMCTGDTTRVGSYPNGASPFDVLDIAGNVREWVADWYGTYPSSPQVDPQGPPSGGGKVVRGSSFYVGRDALKGREGMIAYRSYGDGASPTLGFRCSR